MDELVQDLRRLARLLAKYKYLIAVCSLVGLVGFAVFARFQSPVYRSVATVLVGQVPDGPSAVLPLEDPLVLKSRIAAQFDGSERRALSIKADARTNHLVLFGSSDSAADAKEFVAGIAKSILEGHALLYRTLTSDRVEAANAVAAQIEQLKLEGERIAQESTRVRKADPAVWGLLALERVNLLARVADLRLRLADFNSGSTSLKSRPTVLLGEPSLPTGPSRPRAALYTLVGAVLGFIFGVFIAVFLEIVGRPERSGTQVVA